MADNSETENTMPEGEQNNEQGQQGTQQQAGATETGATQQQAGAGQQGQGDDGKGGKSAVLADLAKERDARQALEKQIEDLKKGAINRDELAAALGLKPEETSDLDALTGQIKALSDDFAKAQKRATLLESAANHNIPKDYLGLWEAAGDNDDLQKQVLDLVAAKAAGGGIPGFVPSNGQGQGDGKTPTLREQLSEAETALSATSPGTPEHRVAQQKVMALKGQQLFEVHQNTK